MKIKIKTSDIEFVIDGEFEMSGTGKDLFVLGLQLLRKVKMSDLFAILKVSKEEVV